MFRVGFGEGEEKFWVSGLIFMWKIGTGFDFSTKKTTRETFFLKIITLSI